MGRSPRIPLKKLPPDPTEIINIKTTVWCLTSPLQTGRLAFPHELDKTLIQREMEFFGLRVMDSERRPPPREKSVVPLEAGFRSRIHVFLVDPASSRGAGVWAGVDIVLILISIVTYVLETEPGYQVQS